MTKPKDEKTSTKKPSAQPRKKTPQPKRNPPEGFGSLRAYAEHRKRRQLDGQSHVAVAKAIEAGRIDAPDPDTGWIQFALADKQWADNTLPTGGKTAPGGVELPPDDLPLTPAGHPDFDQLPPIHRYRVQLDYLKSLQLMDELALRRGQLYLAEDADKKAADYAQALLSKVFGALESLRGRHPRTGPVRKVLDELEGELHSVFSERALELAA